MLKRRGGIRHLRYWYYHLRVQRQALRYYLRGEGLRPSVGQFATLLAIWRGEA